jgi:DNA topoisomerase-6 subunit B
MAEKGKEGKVIAIELATKQREIGVAEFFARNRHLLGFDNKRKALMTTIKEAVDNSLDACEEAQVLPEISIEVIDMGNERFRVIVEDNGPGIVKQQIPKIFAKLLYGSKFHRLRQSLTGDEPVVIRKDGKVLLVKIGDLVDEHLKHEGDFKCSRIEALSFDTSYKFSFRPVSHLIKHKRENEIIKIKTSYGKSIKVTGCHSIFGIDKRTLEVKEVQARDVKAGDLIIAPKTARFHDNESINYVDLLDYIDAEDAKKQGWYFYTDSSEIKKVFENAKIIHEKKEKDKSRKYYVLEINNQDIHVLDDSYKQYMSKGFLPLWLAKLAGIREGTIRTYFHGREYSLPSTIPITGGFAKLLGLFVAEGHIDKRQVGFTFSREERELVRIVSEQAFHLGSSHTVEERPEKNCVRVKIFGGLLSYLFGKWCGKGAHNKKVPDFICTSPQAIRQDFIDYLYVGDGHNTKARNQLMLSTVSGDLANQVSYLWLLQGVVCSISSSMKKGLGKEYSRTYVISVYGNDINVSNYFSANNSYSSNRVRRTEMSACVLARKLGINLTNEETRYLELFAGSDSKEEYSYSQMAELFKTDKIGYKMRYLAENNYLTSTSNGNFALTTKLVQKCEVFEQLQKLVTSDFLFLKVKDTEVINEGFDYVYDLSVPGAENFVAGTGGISAHNSRGQQGIGISAAVMYAQLTTGRPARIWSRISPKHAAHYYELKIDTQKNEPQIIEEKETQWSKEQGTKIELDLEANYIGGSQSIDEYLKQTAIANPHVTLIYQPPKGEQVIFARAEKELPHQPEEIKPHPYGVELGVLLDMLHNAESRTLQAFLTSEFSRVSGNTAKEICENAALLPATKPKDVTREMGEKLIEGIKKTKIMAPPTDCITPIGPAALEKGLKKEINAEFYTSVTRPPDVYRGNPFIIEAGIAYGGNQPGDQPVKIMRFANRVPLLFQQGACAITKSVQNTAWKSYGLSQSNGALPTGPVTIFVHIASVWVPFTSESKEAIAHYPEIIKEIKLALQEVGRKLFQYVGKKRRVHDELKKRGYIEKYIPHMVIGLKEMLKFGKAEEELLQKYLEELLEQHRGEVEDMEFDESKNVDYDENLAGMGKKDGAYDDELFDEEVDDPKKKKKGEKQGIRPEDEEED